MKLVKLQNLVAKCCKTWKVYIVLQSLPILYMFVLRAEIVTVFGSKMQYITAGEVSVFCPTNRDYPTDISVIKNNFQDNNPPPRRQLFREIFRTNTFNCFRCSFPKLFHRKVW